MISFKKKITSFSRKPNSYKQSICSTCSPTFTPFKPTFDPIEYASNIFKSISTYTCIHNCCYSVQFFFIISSLGLGKGGEGLAIVTSQIK